MGASLIVRLHEENGYSKDDIENRDKRLVFEATLALSLSAEVRGTELAANIPGRKSVWPFRIRLV